MSDRSELLVTGEPFAFDAERDAEFERLVGRYPTRESMIMPALWMAQEQQGWISAEAIDYIAQRIGTYQAKVFELATFYTFIYREPVGKYVIHVCDSVICWMEGHQSLLDHLSRKLGIKPGETTPDGMFSLLPVCCIGYCDRAPAIMINKEVYGPLTFEKLDNILERLRAED